MVSTGSSSQGYIIKRPRLTRVLDESDARIILLCAPAGYGKTTLAREWVATRSEPVAWYSGGPEAADVAALASDIAHALAVAQPTDDNLATVADRVQHLAAQGQGPRVLARAILSSLPEVVPILVVDDSHEARSAEAETFLAALAAAGSLRLLVAGRSRPGWVTARMEVYGHVVALDQDSLAFSEEEGREVLRKPSAECSGILQQAQGWPALIGLAAARGALTNGARHLLPRDLYRFFAEDIFSSAHESIREVLLWVALAGGKRIDIVRRLAGETCDELLTSAVTSGLVTRASDVPNIHPLLRTFLLEKLREQPQQDISAKVRAVAAEFTACRAWDEALGLLEEFPERDLIVGMLNAALEELLRSGRVETVHRWAQLARSQAVDDPILLLAEAEVALREGDARRAQTLAQRAAQGLVGDSAALASLTAARAAHLRGDPTEAERMSAEAAALAESSDIKRESLRLAYLSAFEAEEEQAISRLTELLELGDPEPEHAVRLAAAQAIMTMEWEHNPCAAREICEAAAALRTDLRDPLADTAFLNIFTSTALLGADYVSALELAAEEQRVAVAHGLSFVLDHVLLVRARALIGQRRLHAALEAIRELERRADSVSDFVAVGIALNRVKLSVALRDLDRARIEALREPTHWPPALFAESVAHRALIAATRGELTEAIDEARRAKSISRSIEGVALSDLAEAVVAVQRGAHDEAVALMTQVVSIRHLDAVVTACRAYPALARTVTIDPDCARLLTETFVRSHDRDLARHAGLQMPRELRRREGLSPREQEVYELLVQGRTNKEIANTLFISESTAKVHVRHIFEKLGVRSRAEAASVAGSTSLLRPQQLRQQRP